MENKIYVATFHRYMGSPNPIEITHEIEAFSYGQARKYAFEFAKRNFHGPTYLMSVKEK